MNILEFIILSFATWRIASLLVNEKGPFDMFTRIRDWYYNRPFLHKFINLNCVWCISVYIGYVLALVFAKSELLLLLYGLALSGMAILIESVVRFLIREDDKVLSQQREDL